MAIKFWVKLKRWKQNTEAFFEEKGIGLGEEALPTRLHQFAHFWLLVFRSFARNRCPARASALAYATLLALIPMLAIAISVSTSLLKSEGEKPIQEMIDKLVIQVAPALDLETRSEETGDVDNRQEVVSTITAFIGNIRTGTLGITGTVALVFITIGMLRTIESAFNDIWGVQRGRGWVASIVQYWAAITLGPLLLAVALGLSSGPYISATSKWFAQLPLLGDLGTIILRLLPFMVVSIAFAMLYLFMPNTRVGWSAALVGGIVGGCLWQLNSLCSFIYASRVVTYSKIYGSLGLIPLFLVGLFLSWLIVLLGAQVAYAYQNRESYLQEKQVENVNQRGREFVALRLMTRIAQAYAAGNQAPSVDQLSAVVGIPSRLVSQVLELLLQAGLVVEVNPDETGYCPARPLDKITAHDVLKPLRSGQGQDPPTRQDAACALVRMEYERFALAEREVAAAVTLEELARRALDSKAGKETAGKPKSKSVS